MNITYDLDASTVTIADVQFPACLVICPNDEHNPEPDPVDRMLGGVSRFQPRKEILDVDVFVPLENGFLVHLNYYPHDSTTSGPRLFCSLDAQTCQHWERIVDDCMWLPWTLQIAGRTVVEGFQDWRDCETEWLAWHIQRLSTLEYVEPEGPRVQMLPIGQLEEVWPIESEQIPRTPRRRRHAEYNNKLRRDSDG